jgi:23S rRNA pseudouridine1911/1915/1917 synthase
VGSVVAALICSAIAVSVPAAGRSIHKSNVPCAVSRIRLQGGTVAEMKQPANQGRKLPPATEGPLLEWLFKTLHPMSRTSVRQMLKHGQIVVNGTPTTQFDWPLKTSDIVTIVQTKQRDSLVEMLQKAGMPLVHLDNELLVIDKPSGLLSVATDEEKIDTAFAILNECLATHQQGRAFVVHRLDRGTSGLLIFARNEAARDLLQESWEGVRKTYLAVVEGCPAKNEGTIRNYLTEGTNFRVTASPTETPEAKLSITTYRVREKGQRCSLLEVDLETGRKHQIRVHLASLGCPVIGDRTYGAKSDPIGRLGLHAWRLSFVHPVTKLRLEVETPLPKVVAKLVR